MPKQRFERHEPTANYFVEWQPDDKHILRVGPLACMTIPTKPTNGLLAVPGCRMICDSQGSSLWIALLTQDQDGSW